LTSPGIDAGTSGIGSAYDDMLDPADNTKSHWPENLEPLLKQNNYGLGWEIGPYVYISAPSCIDKDSDGYGSPASPSCTHPELDCNDNNEFINPGVQETCGDGIDYDCDGQDSNGYNRGSSCEGNIAFNKTVTASREDWGTLASYMVDGIWDGEHWAAQGTPNWIEIDLGDDYTINKIRAGPFGNYGTGCYYENAWNVRYKSSYDSDWKDFSNAAKTSGYGSIVPPGISITNGQPPSDECIDSYKYYNFTFTPTTARYIRYEVTAGDRDGDSNGDEIEVYGESGTLVCDGLFGTKCQFYHRADTNQDGCITLQELLAFINRWKISSKDVPMPELMEVMGLWKQGTGCS
jgi:hypothetical protein